MKYLNQARTLWAHENRSGSIDDPTYKDWIAAGKPVDDPDPEPPPVDHGDIDNLQKQMKALALVMRSYCNALKAGTYTNKSVADLKANFKQAFDSLF